MCGGAPRKFEPQPEWAPVAPGQNVLVFGAVTDKRAISLILLALGQLRSFGEEPINIERGSGVVCGELPVVLRVLVRPHEARREVLLGVRTQPLRVFQQIVEGDDPHSDRERRRIRGEEEDSHDDRGG